MAEKIRIQPSRLQGELPVPPSKSQSHRAFLFAALGQGESRILSPLDSPDTGAMLRALELLGAEVRKKQDSVHILGMDGMIGSAKDAIDAGNSGIILRFLTAVASLATEPILLTGDHSIRHQRPMQPLLQALSQAGVEARSVRGNGYAPLLIRGPFQGGAIDVEGQDSQFVSALLIASAFSPKPTSIAVRNPGETPWVKMTLSWLDRLGADYQMDNFSQYEMKGSLNYPGFSYRVPADWSSAAFLLAAALVTDSSLTLSPLDFDETQGDRQIVSFLQEMGAAITIDGSKLRISPGAKFKGCTFDVNGCIDALPVLAVLGSFAEGETRLVNAAVARTKECDRIRCMAQELMKMGAEIEEEAEGLRIRPAPLKGAELSSHRDHRVAMSLAVAGLGARGTTTIHDTACIEKTFPSFVATLQSAGASLECLS